MKYLVTGKEMKLLDQNTSGHFQVPELVLMEQAAMHFVWKLCDVMSAGEPGKAKPSLGRQRNAITSSACGCLNEKNWKKGIVFCGMGNNGADGIAIARLLNERGIFTEVCRIKDILHLKGETTQSFRVQESIYAAYNYPVCTSLLEPSGQEYDFVIDAVFGIGLSRDLSDEYIGIVEKINQIPGVKIAVDMPSGVNSDNGQIMGAAVKCDHTITFSFGKVGQLLWPGCEYAGKTHVVDMGITRRSWLDGKPTLACLEKSDLQKLPKRPAHSNKGTFGKLLVIAGSTNMAGAACFAAKAACRSGVGLVKVFTAEENRTIIQTVVPEALLSTYGSQLNEEQFIRDMKWADAIVAGPGLGRSSTAARMVDVILKNADVPVVWDADALNILSEHTDALLLPHTEYIMTPHLGEFSRLTGNEIPWIQSHFLETAVDFARTYHVICVLKDFRTVTANPVGLSYLNLSGNNGMASGGSGDVLSGIIGAFLAQGMKGVDAAAYGVFIHGLAGDTARNIMGTHAMTASDLIESLKEVWKGIDDAEH